MGSNKLRELRTKSFVPSCSLSALSHPRADLSLFVYSRGNALLYFLIYVDDLIIKGSDPSLVYNIIRQLDSKFSIKGSWGAIFLLWS